MADTNPITIPINVTSTGATTDLERFQQALSRVTQQARGLYSTLQTLEQRRANEGFLGQGDMRRMERTLERWRQVQTQLSYQRLGAEGALTAAQGTVGMPEHILRQRAGQLANLNARQQAMNLLESTAGFQGAAGGVPGLYGPGRMTNAFYGPGGGPGSMAGYPNWRAQVPASLPLPHRVYGPGFGPGSTAGYPSAAAPGRMTNAYAGPGFAPGSMAGYPDWRAQAGNPPHVFYGPGFGPGSTAGYPSAAAPGMSTHNAYAGPGFGPGSTAGYPSAAALGRTTTAFAGPGFGPGSMAGYPNWRTAMGPGGGGRGGGGGGTSSLFQPPSWVTGIVGGLTGFQALQLYNAVMDAYEERELGVLRIGTATDEQYGAIRNTITSARARYKMTARQTVGAQLAMAGIVGGQALPGMPSALSLAAAYSMDPAHMGALYGQLALSGMELTPEMGLLAAAGEGARTRGLSRLPVSRFVEEGVKLSSMTNVPITATQAANLTTMMSAFGPRQAENPAQAFASYQERLGPQGKSLVGQALGWQTIAQLAQTTPFVMLGNRRLNIRNSYWDQQEALENAALIPEVQAAMFQQAQVQGGGDRTTAMLMYQRMFRSRSATETRQEFEALEGMAGQPGGLTGALNRPVAGVLSEEQRQARQRRYGPGFGVLERPANIEAPSELPIIQQIQEMQTNLTQMLDRGTLAYIKHESVLEMTNDAFRALNDKTWIQVGLITTILSLVTGNMPGLAAGGGMTVVGIVEILNKLLEQQAGPTNPAAQRAPSAWSAPGSSARSRMGPGYPAPTTATRPGP